MSHFEVAALVAASVVELENCLTLKREVVLSHAFAVASCYKVAGSC